MRLKYPAVILFLLIATGSAQLAPDKERFDVVLHPGDLEERTLKVTNIGDPTIYEISRTRMSGNASDFIFIEMPEDEPLETGDDAEIKIYFALSPEAVPGTYTGFLYLLDSAPPSLPTRIDFEVRVIAQESYGISMTIDDAKRAELSANSDDIAQFELAVKNLGAFRDVANIAAGPLPPGWSVSLLEGEDKLDLPYDLSLDPGTTHKMKIQVKTEMPGRKENLTITATSLGNRSKNSSAELAVDFAAAVRGYNVEIEVPERMVVNRTYRGSFRIFLDVDERIMVGIVTPNPLMVIPLTQMIEVGADVPGVANFTMLASEPGEYPLVFRLMDSHGIAMPEEIATVDVLLPEGLAVLTSDDFTYSTIVSASSMGNGSADFSFFTVSSNGLDEATLEKLSLYSGILILGNESIVSNEVERMLDGSRIMRIGSGSLYENCWSYAGEIWPDGSSGVTLSSPRQSDIFRAYQLSKLSGTPLIVCEGDVTDVARTAIGEMKERNVSLTGALSVGGIDEVYLKPLRDAGIEIEEVEA